MNTNKFCNFRAEIVTVLAPGGDAAGLPCQRCQRQTGHIPAQYGLIKVFCLRFVTLVGKDPWRENILKRRFPGFCLD